MKTWAGLLLTALLVACATRPAQQADERFFSDANFAAPAERIRADDVFALSPAMKRYLDRDIADQLRRGNRQQRLVDALYGKGELRLEYDSAMTRNAAQAFEARSGNCLSLVIMTAAFAKELGLAVKYRSLYTDETLARSGDIYFVVDHINLGLGPRLGDALSGTQFPDVLTVDFLPSPDSSKQRARMLSEKTVIAMYMNNRAAESLARGQLNEAYWWSREAVVQDPRFTRAYNTLGVVYRRHGDLAAAERVLGYAMAQEPSNPQIVANLAQVLGNQGRAAEAGALRQRLAQLESDPPFSFFERGQAALRDGKLETAREMFAREVARAPDYHEFHYWLAITYARLGDARQAREHLALALENSTTRGDRDLYAAKLERIRSAQLLQ
jgi:Tfp pilus assembly protein PilF